MFEKDTGRWEEFGELLEKKKEDSCVFKYTHNPQTQTAVCPMGGRGEVGKGGKSDICHSVNNKREIKNKTYELFKYVHILIHTMHTYYVGGVV